MSSSLPTAGCRRDKASLPQQGQVQPQLHHESTAPSPSPPPTSPTRWWFDLVEWIRSHGGFVHPHLMVHDDVASMRRDSMTTTNNHNKYDTACRGIFVRNNDGVSSSGGGIAAGETLLMLPAHLALQGRHFPTCYCIDNDDCHNKRNNDENPNGTSNQTKRHASPWLRCLAAYYQHVLGNFPLIIGNEHKTDPVHISFAFYGVSLPSSYETLWQWTDRNWRVWDQVVSTDHDEDHPAMTDGPSPQCYNPHRERFGMSREALQRRYHQQIRPYLIQQQVPLPTKNGATNEQQQDHEMNAFVRACETISTRGFHHYGPSRVSIQKNVDDCESKSATPMDYNDDPTINYAGPFLLPLIDLINHAPFSSPKCCTTLVRRHGHDNHYPGGWIMTAEQDLLPGQEILHSYGDDLTALQCLQTFGFVSHDVLHQRATIKATAPLSTTMTPLTPILWSRRKLWEMCWQLVQSEWPDRVAQWMRKSHDGCNDTKQKRASPEQGQHEEDFKSANTIESDEIWSLVVDKTRKVPRLVPDDLLVEAPVATKDGDVDHLSSSLLSDELVTAACIPFLPVEAYQDVMEDVAEGNHDDDDRDGSLLKASVLLQDYFLGTLVCLVLLQMIHTSLASYCDLDESEDSHPCAERPSTRLEQDQAILRRLLSMDEDAQEYRPFKCNADKQYGIQKDPVHRDRLKYGLCVRIEEQMTLMLLQQELFDTLAFLNEDQEPEFLNKFLASLLLSSTACRTKGLSRKKARLGSAGSLE